jgi:hypothetical protein
MTTPSHIGASGSGGGAWPAKEVTEPTAQTICSRFDARTGLPLRSDLRTGMPLRSDARTGLPLRSGRQRHDLAWW